MLIQNRLNKLPELNITKWLKNLLIIKCSQITEIYYHECFNICAIYADAIKTICIDKIVLIAILEYIKIKRCVTMA